MHFLDAANEALAGHNRYIDADTVFSAKINQHRTPPVGGIASNDAGEARVPLGLGSEFELLAQGTVFSFQGLGLDYRWQDIQVEREFLEAVLPVELDIPESSFLDLLVALSLLPMAIFTTMAVLGGGEQDPPEWLVGQEGQWEKIGDDNGDTAALPAPGDTTEGTGTDVHEELVEDEVIEEDESFLFSDLAEQLNSLPED